MSKRKLTSQYFATYFNESDLEKIYISEIQSAASNAIVGNIGFAQDRLKTAILMGDGLKILRQTNNK